MTGAAEPVPPVAAVVCDVDGTLLTSRHVLTRRVRQAVRAAVGAGLRFLLASARPPGGIGYLYDRLGVPREPYVALNGALVVRADGRPLACTRMSGPAALEVLDLATSEGLTPNLFLAGGWFVPRRDRWVADEERATECRAAVVADLRRYAGAGAEKLSLMGPLDRIRRCEAALAARPALLRQIRVERSNPCYLEVTASETGKHAAVTWLLEQMGVPLEAVMAIGDGMNDVEIIRASGLGVAMGHAAPEVRRVARVVTTSNDEDGVAHALRGWVLRGAEA